MRSIILNKNETYLLKIFEFPNNTISQEICFHSVPKFQNSALPSSIICNGDECSMCKLKYNLMQKGMYNSFKEWFLGIYKTKCNLDTFNQWGIPAGVYNINTQTFNYGIIRLWSKQLEFLIDYILKNNILNIGEHTDFNVLKIKFNNYSNIENVDIERLIKHFPNSAGDYGRFMSEYSNIYNNIYESLNISTDKYSTQSVAHTILNIIKNEYLKYNK